MRLGLLGVGLAANALVLGCSGNETGYATQSSVGTTSTSGGVSSTTLTGSATTGAGTTAGATSAGGASGIGSVTATSAVGVTSTGTNTGTNTGTSTTGAEPEPSLLGDVTFSVPSSTFQGELSVGLATENTTAEIRYTTDGTLPNAGSAVYAGTPLTFSDTTELRAQLFVNGVATGSVSTAIYIARSFEVTSDMPLIVVDGFGGGKPVDKEVFARAALMLFEPSAGVASLASLPNVATRAGYHVRGQSSATFAKTPYRVELRDNADADADYTILGMPAEADWGLIGPYVDRALVRNAFVYSLGRDMGLAAPRLAFAEVYINYEARPLAESDYMGLYEVTEIIKNAKNRTNLQQLIPADTLLPELSGGYMFKFEFAAAEEPTLVCAGSGQSATTSGGFGSTGGAASGSCWNDLELFDPAEPVPEQIDYITGYVQTFHDTLHESPVGPYADYVDVASFVDHVIVNEVVRNMDAYVRSVYFYKDRDGKIVAGPLWDYNLSVGVGGFFNNQLAEGWQYEEREGTVDWFALLVVEPQFRSQLVARYQSLRQTLLSGASLDARIASLAAPLSAAAARDYARWDMDGIRQDGTAALFEFPDAPTWEGQLEAMRSWLPARLAWLDSQWQ